MKRKHYVVLLIGMVASAVLSHIPVSATSWGYVEPRIVVDRANVIVIGRYDFTAQPAYSSSVYVGYPFDVVHVYKGEVPRRIIVGIDGNDTGSAQQIQESGSEFLLLLEESNDTEYLVPVSGPNGMVRMTDGRVDEQGEEKAEFYRDYLANSTPLATYASSSKSDLAIRIGIGGVLILVVGVVLYRKIGKRLSHSGRVIQ